MSSMSDNTVNKEEVRISFGLCCTCGLYIMQNTIPPNIQTLTKNYTNNTTHINILSPTSDNIHNATRQQDKHSLSSLTSNYQFNNHTYSDKKQTILSQYPQKSPMHYSKKKKKTQHNTKYKQQKGKSNSPWKIYRSTCKQVRTPKKKKNPLYHGHDPRGLPTLPQSL